MQEGSSGLLWCFCLPAKSCDSSQWRLGVDIPNHRRAIGLAASEEAAHRANKEP
jgi:hypothetical protein